MPGARLSYLIYRFARWMRPVKDMRPHLLGSPARRYVCRPRRRLPTPRPPRPTSAASMSRRYLAHVVPFGYYGLPAGGILGRAMDSHHYPPIREGTWSRDSTQRPGAERLELARHVVKVWAGLRSLKQHLRGARVAVITTGFLGARGPTHRPIAARIPHHRATPSLAKQSRPSVAHPLAGTSRKPCLVLPLLAEGELAVKVRLQHLDLPLVPRDLSPAT